MKKLILLITILLMPSIASAQTAEEYYKSGRNKIGIDKKGALLDFNKAIELNPNYAFAYSGRCFAKGALGDSKGAIQDCNKAIELNPNLAFAYFARGMIKAKLDDYRGAIQDCNKAIEINPNFDAAYSTRGLAKIGLGQKDSGCLDLSKAGEMGYMKAYDFIQLHCQ